MCPGHAGSVSEHSAEAQADVRSAGHRCVDLKPTAEAPLLLIPFREKKNH